MDGRSIVEGCIRHPSRNDSAARTLEHDSALINDKVDKRNPHPARMTNPVLIHRTFAWTLDSIRRCISESWFSKTWAGDVENAEECEFAIDSSQFWSRSIGVITGYENGAAYSKSADLDPKWQFR